MWLHCSIVMMIESDHMEGWLVLPIFSHGILLLNTSVLSHGTLAVKEPATNMRHC